MRIRLSPGHLRAHSINMCVVPRPARHTMGPALVLMLMHSSVAVPVAETTLSYVRWPEGWWSYYPCSDIADMATIRRASAGTQPSVNTSKTLVTNVPVLVFVLHLPSSLGSWSSLVTCQVEARTARRCTPRSPSPSPSGRCRSTGASGQPAWSTRRPLSW